jgi:hypothetical protein
MKAGPILDALVAEHRGWRRLPMTRSDGSQYDIWQRPDDAIGNGWRTVPELPRVSTDMNAAMELACEKLMRFQLTMVDGRSPRWVARVAFDDHTEACETPALATCVAFLQGRGVKVSG